MKRIFTSLIICGLSVGGTCFGREIATLEQNDDMKSRLVEIQPSDKSISKADLVDISKIKVISAGEEFLEDYKRVRKNDMKSGEFLRKYGTKDGMVYHVENNWNVFLRYDEGSSKKSASFSIYHGDPIKKLRQNEENLDRLEKWADDFVSNFPSSFAPFFGGFENPFCGFPSPTSSFWDRFQTHLFDDMSIQEKDLRMESNFGCEKFVENHTQTESLDEAKVLSDSEKSDVAKVSVQKKKSHSWLKNASLLSAGALIGGGLVALKANPEFYGNIASAVKNSAFSGTVLNFGRDVVSRISDSNSWKIVSGFCSNLFGTVKGFF